MKSVFYISVVSFMLLANKCQSQMNSPRSAMHVNNGTRQIINRQPVVAGSFYPLEKDKLLNDLQDYFSGVNTTKEIKNVRAVISPHAGYVYSGPVSASAFHCLSREREYKRIFIIGTSHRISFNGASIYNRGDYITPLGKVPVDIELANSLIKDNRFFICRDDAHNQEHSLEVQIPFLQYWLKQPFKIVPVIIGTQSTSVCEKMAQALIPYFTDDNLFVISSDFSHYPPYEKAIKLDKETFQAIKTNNPDIFIQKIHDGLNDVTGLVTRICGWSAVLTLMYMTENNPDIGIKHVTYKNSGDVEFGDKNRVVGYHAIAFTESENITDETNSHNAKIENNKYTMEKMDNLTLKKEDKKELLKIARQTIYSKLKKDNIPYVKYENLSKALTMPCGAFVTLHKNGELRGCIGRFISEDPLYKVVQRMSVAAATEDYRFPPVTLDEIDDLEIEISVLSPLKKINSADEFLLGKHGIYIIKGNRRGTFLPQVAHETGWSKEEFLGHCARDKARIGWDGWKDADLYTYEADIFNENEFDIHN